jgi:uncharacterized protein (DUF952 family)
LLDSEVKFEKSDDHDLSFPHLYGPLLQRAVIHTDLLRLDDSGFLMVNQLLPV